MKVQAALDKLRKQNILEPITYSQWANSDSTEKSGGLRI